MINDSFYQQEVFANEVGECISERFKSNKRPQTSSLKTEFKDLMGKLGPINVERFIEHYK